MPSVLYRLSNRYSLGRQADMETQAKEMGHKNRQMVSVWELPVAIGSEMTYFGYPHA
jgi:hypothetical protein